MTKSVKREWVDARDLAELTPFAVATWEWWRRVGKGPPYYKVSRRVLYKWSEVEEWIEKSGGE